MKYLGRFYKHVVHKAHPVENLARTRLYKYCWGHEWIGLKNGFSTINNHERNTVTLNGYTITKNTIAINNFINAVYPFFIQSMGHADIIENFVKQLYKMGD